MKVIQNRLKLLLTSQTARVKLYQQVLDRRILEAERGHGELRVPRMRGLYLRLPGKPFHATPEFFFQEAGTTRFQMLDQSLTVEKGVAALIPAGMPHGETWKGDGFLNVIVMFQEHGYSLHLGYLEDRLQNGPLDRFEAPVRNALVRYAGEIAAAGNTRAGARIRRGLYLACLACLREGLNSGTHSNTNRHPLLQRCLEMIDVHFTRMDLSVIWLARELGCSPDYLSRLFRHEMGQRLVPFVHQKRTEFASYLLRESNMNIAETAWACGFRQPSYFNRVFRARTGLKPSQLRLEDRGGKNGARAMKKTVDPHHLF